MAERMAQYSKRRFQRHSTHCEMRQRYAADSAKPKFPGGSLKKEKSAELKRKKRLIEVVKELRGRRQTKGKNAAMGVIKREGENKRKRRKGQSAGKFVSFFAVKLFPVRLGDGETLRQRELETRIES